MTQLQKYKKLEFVKDQDQNNGYRVYSGFVKGRRRNGLGRTINSDQVYEGEYYDGYNDGYGRWIREDSYYIGSWKDGFQNGMGTGVYHPDTNEQRIDKGLWEDGYFVKAIDY